MLHGIHQKRFNACMIFSENYDFHQHLLLLKTVSRKLITWVMAFGQDDFVLFFFSSVELL